MVKLLLGSVLEPLVCLDQSPEGAGSGDRRAAEGTSMVPMGHLVGAASYRPQAGKRAGCCGSRGGLGITVFARDRFTARRETYAFQRTRTHTLVGGAMPAAIVIRRNLSARLLPLLAARTPQIPEVSGERR